MPPDNPETGDTDHRSQQYTIIVVEEKPRCQALTNKAVASDNKNIQNVVRNSGRTIQYFLCFRVYVLVYLVRSTMDMFLVLFGCKRYGMVYHSSLISFPLRSGHDTDCCPTHYQVFRICLFVFSHRDASLLHAVL